MNFEMPEIKVTLFESEDVITTSGGATVTNDPGDQGVDLPFVGF